MQRPTIQLPFKQLNIKYNNTSERVEISEFVRIVLAAGVRVSPVSILILLLNT